MERNEVDKEFVDQFMHGDDELMHFGVKGMKWGVRRYQDKSGKLTDVGKKRYRSHDPNEGDEQYWQGEAQRINRIYREKGWKISDDFQKKWPTEEELLKHKDEIIKTFNDLEKERTAAHQQLKDRIFPRPSESDRESALKYFSDREKSYNKEYGFKNADEVYELQNQLRLKYEKSIGRDWDGDGTELWEAMDRDLKGNDRKTFERLTSYFDDPRSSDHDKVRALSDNAGNQIIAYNAVKEYKELKHTDLGEIYISALLDNKDDEITHADLGEAFVSAYIYDDNELMHYGVKGMKWGVRRTAAQLGHYLSSKGKKVMDRLRARRDKKKQVKEETKATKKDVKDMTNDELRAAIARKKLENEYEQMFPKKASLISSVVAPAMINSAKNFVQKSLDTAVNNILEKNNNKKETDSIESYVEKLSSMSPDDIKKYQTAAKVAGLINTIKSSKGNKGNKGNNG